MREMTDKDITTEEIDPCDSEEFKEFQWQNHCSQVSFEDLERWYFRASKDYDRLKAELERTRQLAIDEHIRGDAELFKRQKAERRYEELVEVVATRIQQSEAEKEKK